jgi:hypothetical protein
MNLTTVTTAGRNSAWETYAGPTNICTVNPVQKEKRMKKELIDELVTVYREKVEEMIRTEDLKKRKVVQDMEFTRMYREELALLLQETRSETVQEQIERLQSQIDCTTESDKRQKQYKKHKLQTTRMKGILYRINKELKED